MNNALSVQPKHFAARAMLVRVELAKGQLAAARKQVGILLNLNPSSQLGHELLGDIEMRSGDANKAVFAYKKAGLGNAVLVKLVRALKQSGQADQVQLVLNDAINASGSRTARMLLAMEYQTVGQFDGAAAQYRKVLERNPKDLAALNNLALVLLKSDASAALEYAEQAYELASDNPSVGDTYGWVLVNNGKLSEGTRILRDASLRQSRSPLIRYHLAYALAEQGRKEQAFKELQQARKLKMSADLKKDVDQLLNKLK